MKKVLAIALAIILALGMTVSATACGKLNNNEDITGRVTPI